ncbi:UNKNOWN [Stylonychia lemnae]|uniref:Uncharacterized protein n=1 Tax=Stylonychia lemnae TaxID=5949 RepID=A0A077ZTT6_STYLE|nr:UNKNOWN [Stylonychia lemnae]|eukprot:CDW73303.1 UNKNOWN [Stylonychia lemnae]
MFNTNKATYLSDIRQNPFLEDPDIYYVVSSNCLIQKIKIEVVNNELKLTDKERVYKFDTRIEEYKFLNLNTFLVMGVSCCVLSVNDNQQRWRINLNYDQSFLQQIPDFDMLERQAVVGMKNDHTLTICDLTRTNGFKGEYIAPTKYIILGLIRDEFDDPAYLKVLVGDRKKGNLKVMMIKVS